MIKQASTVAILIVVALAVACSTGGEPGAGGHISAGMDRDQEGHFDDAIEEYTEAIQLDPQFLLAYIKRGVAYHNLQEYERAIEDFDEALRLDSESALAYKSRGDSLRMLGQLDRAFEDCTERLTGLRRAQGLRDRRIDGLIRIRERCSRKEAR